MAKNKFCYKYCYWLMFMRVILIIISCFWLIACQKHSNLALAEYNAQLGLTYLAQGDRVNAKRKLWLALNEAPNAVTTNTAMAYFMEKSGDNVVAQRYYQRALSLAPHSGAQLNNYAAFLCRLGKYKESQAYFARALLDLQYAKSA